MKRSFPHSLNRVLLTVPVAAMMLGASQSQAVTSIGINFWGSYGYADSYAGRVVSGTAFGIPAANWGTSYTPINPDPATFTYNSYTTTGTFVAGPIGVDFDSGGNYFTGITPTNSPSFPQGETDVLNGYIFSGAASGPAGGVGLSVELSNLATTFPNGYVVQPVVAKPGDNHSFEPITVSDGATTSICAFGPLRATGGYYSFGTVWSLGAASGTFTSDTLTVTGGDGSALSGILITDKLLVTDAHPPTAIVAPGGTTTLTSGVIGIGTLTYQWRHGGINISGATSPTYTITGATAGDEGNYDVIVTSSAYPGAPVTSAVHAVDMVDNVQLWTGAVDGSWDIATTANWSYDGSPSTYVDTNPYFVATFDGGGSNRDIILNVDVHPTVTTFTGSSDYSLSGSGHITGTGSIVKSGSGKLTLNSRQTHSGGTFVTGGTLQFGDLPATDYATEGLVRGNVTVTSGGVLLLASSNAFGYADGFKVDSVTLVDSLLDHQGDDDNGWGVAYTLTGSTMRTTGAGHFSFGAGTTIHTLASANPSVLAGVATIRENNVDGRVTINTDDGPASIDFDVTAALTNESDNGVKKTGAGLMRLTTRATYAGGTIVDGGTLQLGDLPDTDYGVTGLLRGNITVNTGGTLFLQSSNAFGYGGGVKVDTVNLNGGTLTHSGSGDNGWGVAYTLTGGLMQTTGGVARFSFGANTSVTTGASANASTIAGTVVLREGNPDNIVTFTVADGAAAEDLIVSAAVSGAGRGITKAGPGLMSLTGAVTYTGPTNITGGTLKVTSAFFPDNVAISMAPGAVLDLQTGTTDAVGGLLIDGQPQPGGIYGAIGSGVQYPVAYITGTGRLEVPINNPYTAWAKAPPYNLTGNNALPDADPDHDGISNLIEFIIGGNPTTGNDYNLLPVISSATEDAGNGPTDYLVFSYHRATASSFLPPRAEYSTNLQDWNTASNGDDGVVEVVNGESASSDRVDVYIPKTLGPDGKLFVRLAAPIP